MAHLSKKYVERHIIKAIEGQLVDALVEANSRKLSKSFLQEILGDEERIMIAKRLMIIAMLLDGVSLFRIARIVGVSESTVARTKKRMYEREFQYITFFLEDKKRKKKFWDDVGTIVRGGLPPQGKNRWVWLDDYFQEKV